MHHVNGGNDIKSCGRRVEELGACDCLFPNNKSGRFINSIEYVVVYCICIRRSDKVVLLEKRYSDFVALSCSIRTELAMQDNREIASAYQREVETLLPRKLYFRRWLSGAQYEAEMLKRRRALEIYLHQMLMFFSNKKYLDFLISVKSFLDL